MVVIRSRQARGISRGVAIVIGIIALAGAGVAYNYYSKRPAGRALLPSEATPGEVTSAASPEETAGPTSTPTPGATLTLAELTTADIPASVTLLKPAQIRFKKGSYFVTKQGAPLFFLNQYLRDAKGGEEFQILDYDPGTRRVFLRAHDPEGRDVAVNTLDLHGSSTGVETVPASTVVAVQGVADGDALVTYNGERFAVPVDDTDLLQQAADRRAGSAGSGN